MENNRQEDETDFTTCQMQRAVISTLQTLVDKIMQNHDKKMQAVFRAMLLGLLVGTLVCV